MSFSCATCMSTLGFCIIIFLFSGSLPSTKTTLYYKACTKHFPVLLCTTKLAQSPSQYYLYYKACTKHFPVLLCTTKLAQNTFQYYCVLQSLHKARFNTTLYYKVCTKHFPILLCTTKLAQSTSQYYFVLQSLHKALPSATLYYKVCTNYFPALLCTTKARSSTTLYYKICTKHFPETRDETRETQRRLHKLLPSTTLYYKGHVPVLLCTTKFAQSTSQRLETRHGKTKDSRRNTSAQQNEHFVRDVLQF